MTLTRQQILDLLAKESKQDAAKAVLDALNSKDFATEDKLEAVRALLAGTITVGGEVAVNNHPTSTEGSNFPATQDVQLTGSNVALPVDLQFHDLDGDPLPVTTSPSDTVFSGSKNDVDTTAAQVTANQSCREVLLQADSENTVDVLVGNNSEQNFKLYPGFGIVISLNNVNLLYVKTASSTATVNWIARG